MTTTCDPVLMQVMKDYGEAFKMRASLAKAVWLTDIAQSMRELDISKELKLGMLNPILDLLCETLNYLHDMEAE